MEMSNLLVLITHPTLIVQTSITFETSFYLNDGLYFTKHLIYIFTYFFKDTSNFKPNAVKHYFYFMFIFP